MTSWIDARVRDYLLGVFPETMRIARDHGLPHNYAAGERPRHFAGALDVPEEVEVLLLTAEPGSAPYEWERGRSQETWLDDVTSDGIGRRGGHPFVYDPSHSSDPRYETRFAVWPAMFLSQVWPSLGVAERIRRTVVANSFWMQAHFSTGKVPRAAETDFAPILAGFVDLFPNAVVVAAGSKARDRMTIARRKSVSMQALMLPAYNTQAAKLSRDETAAIVRSRLGVSD